MPSYPGVKIILEVALFGSSCSLLRTPVQQTYNIRNLEKPTNIKNTQFSDTKKIFRDK